MTDPEPFIDGLDTEGVAEIPYGLEIYELFRRTLTAGSGPAKRAKDLSDGIRCLVRDATDVIPPVLCIDIYSQMQDVVDVVPHDSEYLDIMADALVLLKQHGGLVRPGDEQYYRSSWESPPGLDTQMYEYFTNGDSRMLAPHNAPDLARWHAASSFAARVLSKDPALLPFFYIESLRFALEEPAVKGADMEARIAVACEYLARCGSDILELLRGQAFVIRHGDDFARRYRKGSLCDASINIYGLDRWKFWRARLVKIGTQLEELELSEGPSAKRIAEAIEKMDEAEDEIQPVKKWAKPYLKADGSKVSSPKERSGTKGWRTETRDFVGEKLGCVCS